MATHDRQSTGIDKLDAMLGGGLLPGTLTVIVGATGIGKTQLAIQYANAGRAQEGRRGVVFDMSARGDSQCHSEYALRMFDWTMSKIAGEQVVNLESFFAAERDHGDYLRLFDYSGRRVTKRDLDFEQWQQWQVELNAKLRGAIGFFYGNCVQGVKRFVVDGIEPTDRPHESIQFNLFEYIYH
jgi:KaiC/GvpD/RAD55 family RecA-like ATPase